jgi:hypothetical protein
MRPCWCSRRRERSPYFSLATLFDLDASRDRKGALATAAGEAVATAPLAHGIRTLMQLFLAQGVHRLQA